MSDHERIFLEPESDEADVRDTGRCWCCDKVDHDWTEYVRADVLLTDRDALKTENARLKETLVSMKGWVRHWQGDVDCNLMPTDQTLEKAAQEIAAALSGERQ